MNVDAGTTRRLAARVQKSERRTPGERNVSIGISLDAPGRKIADRTRKGWSGHGVHGKVLEAMDRLRGYDAWCVICTMTRENACELRTLRWTRTNGRGLLFAVKNQ